MPDLDSCVIMGLCKPTPLVDDKIPTRGKTDRGSNGEWDVKRVCKRMRPANHDLLPLVSSMREGGVKRAKNSLIRAQTPRWQWEDVGTPRPLKKAKNPVPEAVVEDQMEAKTPVPGPVKGDTFDAVPVSPTEVADQTKSDDDSETADVTNTSILGNEWQDVIFEAWKR